jgi:transposase
MVDSFDYKKLFEQQCALTEQLQQQLAQQTLLIQKLQQQLEQLLRAKFGKKSERNKNNNGDSNPPGSTNPPQKPSSSKKNTPRGKPPFSLSEVDIQHDIPEHDKYCPKCHNRMQAIKPMVSEQLAYRPASLYIKKNVRHRYSCRPCNTPPITAPMPNQPIEKGLPDSSLLAQVLIDKYQDHLPMYRQECRWLRHGVALARQTLCDWAINSAKWLGFLVAEMKKDILASDKVSSDDTPYPVQAPGKTITGRLWVYIGGGGNAPPIATVYEYTPNRSGQAPLAFLQGFRGYLQADAYPGYDKLYQSGEIIEVACMAHCRRKFFDAAVQGSSNEQSKSQIAIDFIRQLYAIERHTQSMTPTERFHYRRRFAKPILKRFLCWLRKTKHRAYKSLLLGKAITYALNHWRALCHYCRDGRLDIDNNLSERAIKPLVIGRKNYLFAGSHEGAKAAAIIYSIIETCKMWGINTYDYLIDVLARLPNTLNKNIRQLLPYHWQPVHATR